MRSVHKIAVLAAFFLLGFSAVTLHAASKYRHRSLAASEDVVLQWNRVLGQTLQVPGVHNGMINPLRSFAMMHLAMYDAVNSIDGTHTPYLIEVPGTKHASIEAAAAKAAHDVLVGLYPSQQANFDLELANSLSGISPNRALQGIRVGARAAKAMLENRSGDGWEQLWTPFILAPTPGNWQETSPGPYPGFAVFTNYSGVRPFAMTSSHQFLPAPPPALNSAAYAASLNEVKELGSASSATRTPDQGLTALLWAIPPVSDALMFGVAARTSIDQGLTTVERARLFALVFMTYHDALETAFTSQFYYGRWRPVTAIHRADEDGNAATTPDPTWVPLLGANGTPPHPSYGSAASSASASLAKSLELYYGSDNIAFDIDHGANGVRHYLTFTSLTDEVAHSRVYGGVHFPYDIAAGQKAGRDVASYVFYNFLTPR